MIPYFLAIKSGSLILKYNVGFFSLAAAFMAISTFNVCTVTGYSFFFLRWILSFLQTKQEVGNSGLLMGLSKLLRDDCLDGVAWGDEMFAYFDDKISVNLKNNKYKTFSYKLHE